MTRNFAPIISTYLQGSHCKHIALTDFIDEPLARCSWLRVMSALHIEAKDLLANGAPGPRRVKQIQGVLGDVEQWVVLRIPIIEALGARPRVRLTTESNRNHVWSCGLCQSG